MEVMKERPPYVSFEVKLSKIGKPASKPATTSPKDVVYAIVTPVGSKDRIPRVASEWLAMLAEQVQQQRFPGEWLNAFHGLQGLLRRSRSPAERYRVARLACDQPGTTCCKLFNFSVRTVEDLAVANEETLSRLGMGGRALGSKRPSSGSMLQRASAP